MIDKDMSWAVGFAQLIVGITIIIICVIGILLGFAFRGFCINDETIFIMRVISGAGILILAGIWWIIISKI